MCQIREGVPYVKVYRYKKFETLTAVTHLLITKYILKLAGICGFSVMLISVLNIKLTCE